MNGDFGHFGRLPNEISTICEDVNLPKRTEERGSHSVDCDMSIFVSDNAFLDTNNHTVEVVKHSSSAHCGQLVKQSTCSFVMPVVKDEIEQSVGEADDYNDVIADYNDEHDVTQHIDSVFFACDPAGTGTVAVSDIITYLSDTLHVSYYLHV